MSLTLNDGLNIIEEKVTKVNGEVSFRKYEKKRPLGKGTLFFIKVDSLPVIWLRISKQRGNMQPKL